MSARRKYETSAPSSALARPAYRADTYSAKTRSASFSLEILSAVLLFRILAEIAAAFIPAALLAFKPRFRPAARQQADTLLVLPPRRAFHAAFADALAPTPAQPPAIVPRSLVRAQHTPI